MSNKRRNTLSMGERLRVLDDLKTLNVSAVARKYNVHPTTIWRIQNNAPKVMEFIDKGKVQQKRRIIRTSVYDALEQNLMAWLIERRTLGVHITDTVLMQKAKELRNSMGLTSDFKVSKGWLDGFKKRQDIQSVKFSEKNAIDEDAATKFCDHFKRFLDEANIDEDNLYNMGETGLLWKALPFKTLAEVNGKSVKGYKRREERITIALCGNATGTHKVMPFVISKCENPSALKDCKDKLPVAFKSQKNAFMTNTLFCDWYESYFKPSVREHQIKNGVPGKIVLLLDNFGSRTVPTGLLNEDDFIIIYLPPNTASLIQPMDQGIIAKFKDLYRQKIVRHASRYEGGINKYQQEITIKDSIEVLYESWMQVTADNIINSWEKIIPHQSNPYYRAMRQDLSNSTGDTYTEEDIREFMSSCEKAERKRFTREEDEETQEDEEVQENIREQRNKKEELQYLFQSLEEKISQEPPVIKNMLEVIKNHVLDTDPLDTD